MPYLLCESSHEVGWVLWSIFILPWSRAGLCFSLYLERECVRIYQRRHARSTLKNGFAWFRPNRTSWSGFFVPGTIFGSIRFIWAKNQPSRPFHSKDTCPFGPYVLPFPILFYSIKDILPPHKETSNDNAQIAKGVRTLWRHKNLCKVDVSW